MSPNPSPPAILRRRLALAAALAFSLLAVAVPAHWTRGGDEAVLAFLARWRLAPLDHVFLWVTRTGSAWVLTPLCALGVGLLLARGRRREALVLAVGYGGAALAAAVLKLVVDRARPELFAGLVSAYPDPAFPSGHATQSGAFVLALVLAAARIRPAAALALAVPGALLVVLVAVSRLYLQVHWPSDVVGGLLLAAAWVLAVDALTPR